MRKIRIAKKYLFDVSLFLEPFRVPLSGMHS
jgi:hypothetical protein